MKYLLLTAMLFSTLVFAADSKEKFYDFSDMMINGDFKKPEMLKVSDKKSTKFDRMLKLKASFIPQLEKSDKDNAIK